MKILLDPQAYPKPFKESD